MSNDEKFWYERNIKVAGFIPGGAQHHRKELSWVELRFLMINAVEKYT